MSRISQTFVVLLMPKTRGVFSGRSIKVFPTGRRRRFWPNLPGISPTTLKRGASAHFWLRYLIILRRCGCDLTRYTGGSVVFRRDEGLSASSSSDLPRGHNRLRPLRRYHDPSEQVHPDSFSARTLPLPVSGSVREFAAGVKRVAHFGGGGSIFSVHTVHPRSHQHLGDDDHVPLILGQKTLALRPRWPQPVPGKYFLTR